MFAMYFSVGVPPWSFMPSSTERVGWESGGNSREVIVSVPRAMADGIGQIRGCWAVSVSAQAEICVSFHCDGAGRTAYNECAAFGVRADGQRMRDIAASASR